MPATKLEITASRRFPEWLLENELSLAISTYQSGKLLMVGCNKQGQLNVHPRNFARPMGLCGDKNGFYLITEYQLLLMENQPGIAKISDYDHNYIPQLAWTTGDIDGHEVARIANNKPVIVNTRFSCLSTIDEFNHLQTIWKPPFISRLAAEDRCHLNGVAVKEGEPKWVTMLAQADMAEGWRSHMKAGGVVMDIENNHVVAEGLSMPHSPRWYRDTLWLLDSGNGNFIKLDPDTGEQQTVAFCPGFARGLEFIDHYALIGLSKPRDHALQNLALDKKLQDKGAKAQCGVMVVDLDSGDTVCQLFINGIDEIFDLLVLKGVQRARTYAWHNKEMLKIFPQNNT
ncbi:MAG: TIGR03032 family protein [bacterium]